MGRKVSGSGARKREYMARIRPVFDPQAVFSDESAAYRTPFEPGPGEEVTIRIRVGQGQTDEVTLVAGSERYPMQLTDSRRGFDFYAVTVCLTDEIFRYFFELRAADMVCCYTKLGVTHDLGERGQFRICPGYTSPAWARGAVMYQIYTDRFRQANPGNDVKSREYAYLGGYVTHVDDWDRPPEGMDVRNFYGGDLEGVEEKLDYLKDLGVEVIYFNPLFVSPSNHRYDIQDYDHIDPHIACIVRDEGELLDWGNMNNRDATRYICRVTDPANLEASDEYFAHLVEEIHRRGMKVILDGVFNHCGSFNKWMDRERIYEGDSRYPEGAYISADSPYRSFFRFANEQDWPYNDSYDGWWGHSTLPKLNYEESPKLEEYILQIAKKWVSPPYNVDGWRLDVAADLGRSSEYNHLFWKKFRQAVREANPDALILAEHYGEAYDWLQGDEWDTVMNYDAFMEPVSWFLTGMEKHSDQFREDLLGNGENFIHTMRYHMASFMGGSLLCAMNELDNHDHSRFLTRTNHTVGRVNFLGPEAAAADVCPAVMREAVLIQMTFIGAPTIYYGDEAGVVGFTDPDSRRTYPWGHEDLDMLCFFREAVLLHSRNRVLRDGSIKLLTGGPGYITYARFTEEAQAIVAVSTSEEEMTVEVPVWEAGLAANENTAFTAVLQTDRDGFSLPGTVWTSEGGVLTLTLKPQEAVVLLHSEAEPAPSGSDADASAASASEDGTADDSSECVSSSPEDSAPGTAVKDSPSGRPSGFFGWFTSR